MGNLSLEAAAATQHLMSLLLPSWKHNCGQNPHTFHGQVHGSGVFAMIYFLPLKRLAKVCWAMLLEWGDEITRSNSKRYIQIASRHSACLLFSWSNLLWLFIICFIMPNVPTLLGSQPKHPHSWQMAIVPFNSVGFKSWQNLTITSGDGLYQVICHLISYWGTPLARCM